MGLPEKDVWSVNSVNRIKNRDMKMIFATNNQHKVEEIRSVIGNSS
jgi:hypothetical protein